MAVHADQREIRSGKTEKALSSAMFSLLHRRNFKEITVKDICEESLISRTTFYSQFTDKYNFLKWWLIAVWPNYIVKEEDAYEIKEKNINQNIMNNQMIIKNLFLDADRWTVDTLFDVFRSVLHLGEDPAAEGELNPKYIVLSNFYIGGMLQYVLWQVKNGFPKDAGTMNIYLCEMMKMFQEWKKQ